MSEAQAEVRAFLEAAARADSLQALDETFIRYAQRLGFSTAMFIRFGDREGGIVPKLLFGRDPTEWLQRYAERDYGLIDPTVPLAFRSRTGFTWSAAEPRSRGKVGAFFGEAREMWAQDSFIVPVRGPYAELSVVNLLSDHPLTLPPELASSIQAMSSIYATVGVSLADAPQFDLGTPSKPFTRREAQCVYWLSVGKRDAEISGILGISAPTVRQHIEMAKSKLNAVSRPQLVAKALLEGRLLPDQRLIRGD